VPIMRARGPRRFAQHAGTQAPPTSQAPVAPELHQSQRQRKRKEEIVIDKDEDEGPDEVLGEQGRKKRILTCPA
jgi:hypothetical protein